jgi:hypothetical protein
MTQNGFLAGGSKAIDQLSYTYLSGGSNKLTQVMDGANNPTSQLGDFHYPSTKVSGTNDYAYDGDGNLTQDNNKAIAAITYNYLNLPQLVHFQGKGNISYVYDALGDKLAKITADSMAHHSIRTLYLDGMVYQQTDTLSSPGCKRQIIGSIFPEKLTFDGQIFRTTRLNEAVQLIYSLDVAFRENKNGTSLDFSNLSHQVNALGLEPRTHTFKVYCSTN